MRKSFVLPAVIGFFCGMALLAGCSYTVMPERVFLQNEGKTRSLAGAALIVKNAERDSSDYSIPTDTGEPSALHADRKRWSAMLVEALAGELAKRGARVSSRAELTIRIALPEIKFSRDNELYRFSVKVLVSSSTGWQKNYEGTAESGRESFESLSGAMNRLAGMALAEDVKTILSDGEFLKQLQEK